MAKDDKATPHEKSDHELANTADEVEIGPPPIRRARNRSVTAWSQRIRG